LKNISVAAGMQDICGRRAAPTQVRRTTSQSTSAGAQSTGALLSRLEQGDARGTRTCGAGSGLRQ
ncbi:hypothetical protein U1Q18_027521, partial [Sarracenia purpurea var. burkii]